MKKLNEITTLMSLVGLVISLFSPFIGLTLTAIGIFGSYYINSQGEFDSKLRYKISDMKQQYNINGRNESHLYWIENNCSNKEIKRAIKLNIIPSDWSITKYPNNPTKEIKKLNWEKFNTEK